MLYILLLNYVCPLLIHCDGPLIKLMHCSTDNVCLHDSEFLGVYMLACATEWTE